MKHYPFRITVAVCAILSIQSLAATNSATSLTPRPPDLTLGATVPAETADPTSWKRVFDNTNADGKRLWSQTRMMFGLGVVAVGVLYAMPESITGWDRDVEITDMPERWWNNVSRRPIWDKDHWFFNYIAHPYCGGVYYQMARKSGFSPWHSFLYTTVMSTFFWEYGVEAFAERPSIQDLIVTPLTGWIYGEWAFHMERRIIANRGEVLGSTTLGDLCRFFLDPIDPIGRGVNRVTGRDWVITGSVVLNPATDLEADTSHMSALRLNRDAELRLGVRIRF